jgi:hypothetical protein
LRRSEALLHLMWRERDTAERACTVFRADLALVTSIAGNPDMTSVTPVLVFSPNWPESIGSPARCPPTSVAPWLFRTSPVGIGTHTRWPPCSSSSQSPRFRISHRGKDVPSVCTQRKSPSWSIVHSRKGRPGVRVISSTRRSSACQRLPLAYHTRGSRRARQDEAESIPRARPQLFLECFLYQDVRKKRGP